MAKSDSRIQRERREESGNKENNSSTSFRNIDDNIWNT